MTPPPVSIRGLVKQYGDLTALNAIDLDIRAGEFFGLLGPNGAGKTTTINILAGLTLKTAGDVKIFGHDLVSEYRDCRRHIGLVPQEFNFDQFVRLERMLVFQGGFFGMPLGECRKRARELMAAFALEDKADTQLRHLSGGMKRRAIIARALMHRPDMLILDEPTAGVDVDLRKTLWKLLRRLKDEGTTILLTTHYIEEAEALCNRIAIIREGEIVADDTTRNLVRRLDGETTVITFTSPADASLLETLADLSPVLTEDREELTLSFCRSKITFENVLQRVMKTGVSVSGIRPGENRLETVFLELTQATHGA